LMVRPSRFGTTLTKHPWSSSVTSAQSNPTRAHAMSWVEQTGSRFRFDPSFGARLRVRSSSTSILLALVAGTFWPGRVIASHWRSGSRTAPLRREDLGRSGLDPRHPLGVRRDRTNDRGECLSPARTGVTRDLHRFDGTRPCLTVGLDDAPDRSNRGSDQVRVRLRSQAAAKLTP
jgi:hypothetical protein